MAKQGERSLKLTPKGIDLAKKALIKFPSQADLAAQTLVNKAAISRTTLSNFLQGKPVQRPHFLAICKKLKLNLEEVTDLSDDDQETVEARPPDFPSPPDSPDNPPTNLPPERGIRDSKRFFGRDKTLEELHQLLQTRGQVAICSVSGMGGLGKTELAIQYAKKYLHHYPTGIFWLDASGEIDIPTQIVNFTQETFDGFTVNRELPPESQVRQCWRKWQASPTPGKMLAIFNDLAEYDRIKPYLPDLAQVRVIVTTRWNLGSDFAELSLKVLALSDAIELLKSRAGAERIEQQLAEAKRLCNWRENLPLGLELVGHFLEQEPNLSVGELLISLQDGGLEHDAMRREADKPWTFTAERGVAAAFDLSWQRLDRPSRRLGCMLSLFAAASIPWQLVEMAESDRCNRSGEEFNREFLQSCRRNLRRLHLLEDEGEGSYRLHQLIRQFFREKLGILTRESEP